MLPGPYVVPAYRVARPHPAHQQDALRHLSRARPLRGHLRARTADRCDRARGSASDPLEVRRVNLIGPDAMPFARGVDALGTEVVYDSGDYPALLDQPARRASAMTRSRAASSRCAARAGEQVGFGLGFFVEKSGLGPFDDARVLLEADGGIEVVTGAASVGQGIETVLAQICAEALGVPPEAIRVIHGQTDRIARRHGRLRLARHGDDRLAPSISPRPTSGASFSRWRAGCCRAAPEDLTIEDGRHPSRRSAGGPPLGLADLARELASADGRVLAGRRAERGCALHQQPHDLSLRHHRRGGAGRRRDRRRRDRAAVGRLRRRPRGQPDADRGADRRRRAAGHRRRAARGVRLRRGAASRWRRASPTT